MLSCPACGTLVHADELKRLAAAAQQAPPSEALALWRQAIALLPRDSQQYSVLTAKIDTISRELEANPQTKSHAGGGKWKGAAASGGVLLMLFAKFKTAIFLILGQGKLLLLGLTKMGTLLSMFGTFAIYWGIYGWRFAAGLILSIYVHEMGHVFALRRLGLAASAPMFIPGFGALIRLQQQYLSPREDARIGLAGPLWGLVAAIFSALLGLAFHSPVFLVIAKWGAWINLFNLTPVWSLDGARGFHALRRPERIAAALIFTAAWLPAGVGVAVLAAAASVYGLLQHNEPETTDRRAFWEYVALCLALTAFNYLPTPIAL